MTNPPEQHEISPLTLSFAHSHTKTHAHARGEDCITNELVWLQLSYGHERMVGPHPSAGWESVLSAPNATGCQGPVLTDLSAGNSSLMFLDGCRDLTTRSLEEWLPKAPN